MIHFISEGGLIKRYVCDTADDIKHCPKVAAGSTVQVITSGDVYTINEEGVWNLTSSLPTENGSGTPGKDGYTPIKGVDYFTEDDKKEIIQSVLEETKPIKPIYDAENNFVFCNGTGVIVSDNGTNNLISYYLDVKDVETLEVPYGCEIYGGGNGEETPISFPASSIIVNGGKFKAICGGGRGGCHVGSVSMVINGGEFEEGFFGGGSNNKITNDKAGNSVGNVFMVINDFTKAKMIYGGGATGLCHVGHIQMEVNGGEAQYLIPSNSNGYCGSATMIINDGKFTVVQPTGNGSVGNCKIILKKGEIARIYGGGVAGTIVGKTTLKLLGGKITEKIGQGASNDGTAKHISGGFVDEVLPESFEQTALDMNLKYYGTQEEILTQWDYLE